MFQLCLKGRKGNRSKQNSRLTITVLYTWLIQTSVDNIPVVPFASCLSLYR